MMLGVALGLLSGCAEQGAVNDHFFVRSGDAVLPVQVRGNAGSGTVVLYESGGPSGPAIAERLIETLAFAEPLEEEVALAFYDRRGVGNAHGDYTEEDLSIKDYLGDLHAIQQVLRERYAPDRVVLMGHSWGGQVTARYLMKHPNAVDAWVPIAGVMMVGDDLYIPYRRDFTCRVADEQEQLHPGQAIWSEMLDWCEANPIVEPDSKEKDELWEYLSVIYDRLGGEPESPTGPLLSAVFGSMYNLIDTFRDAGVSEQLFNELRDDDLLPELGQITLPTLVVSGEYDDTIPVELGDEVFERIDTPPDQKRHLVIEGGGHYPFDAAPKAFNEAVLELIDRL
ncbi:MAG: alpha/beta hydrolase [Myxococcota bacterium]